MKKANWLIVVASIIAGVLLALELYGLYMLINFY